MDWAYSLVVIAECIAGQYCQSRPALPIGRSSHAPGDSPQRIHAALQQELPRGAVYSALD
jgi:hypothetical protein